MDAIPSFDPHSAQARAEWRNRVAEWRAAPGETAFHATALLAAALLAGWLLGAAWPTLQKALAALLDRPALAVLLWTTLVAADQYGLRHAQRARWRSDWLAAQPVSTAQRLRRRLIEALPRALRLWLPLAFALLFAGRPAVIPVMTLITLGGALVGQRLADRQPAPPTRRRVQATDSVLHATGPGTFWRWQWIVAGRALTPNALAACLPVMLLIPRGPAQVLGVAIVLVMLLATAGAWLRMCALLVDAQRWLDGQPLRGGDWLPAALALPLALLLVVLLIAMLALWLAAMPLPLLLAPLLLAALALLHLGAVAAERARPRRIVMLSAAHQLLLLAGLQALPPLVPLQWALQFGWLLRRGWRA